MDQYASRPGHSTYCYTELTVSSPALKKYVSFKSGLKANGQVPGTADKKKMMIWHVQIR